MSQIKPIFAAVVAGAATSFLVVSALAPKLPQPDQKPPLSPVQIVADAKRGAGVTSDASLHKQLSALEKRVSGMEQEESAAEDAPELAEEERAPGDEGDPGPTPEQFAMAHHDEYQAQPVDQVWAPRAEAKLEEELRRFAPEQGFAFSDIECRNDACIATLEFPSYEKAREHAGGLVTLPLSVNCALGTTVPPPNDPSAKYSVQVFMTNCQKQPS